MYTIDDIDIFVLTHQRASLLEETIKSLMRQTVRPKEIIVLDNESTDNTRDVVALYKKDGIKYIKTFGRDGNFYESQKLASKKFVVRFHDDNLIHPQYLEKVLLCLNTMNNVGILCGSYTTFCSSSVSDYPKEYINITPIQNNFLLVQNKKEFVRYLFMQFDPVADLAIGGTPFLVVKTEYFKSYVPQTSKFGKADDVDFYLYCLEKGGNFVCINDKKCAFFREHEYRDSNNDDTGLTYDQMMNVAEQFADIIKDEFDQNLWKNYFIAISHIWNTFVKKHIINLSSMEDFIKDILAKDIISERMYRTYIDVVVPKQNEERYLDKKLFSIYRLFNTNKIVLKFFGIKFSFKIKQKYKNSL